MKIHAPREKPRLKSVWVKNSHEIRYKNNFWFSEFRISGKGLGACPRHCYQMGTGSIPWSWLEVPTPAGCPLSLPSLLAQEARTGHKLNECRSSQFWGWGVQRTATNVTAEKCTKVAFKPHLHLPAALSGAERSHHK